MRIDNQINAVQMKNTEPLTRLARQAPKNIKSDGDTDAQKSH